MVVGKLVVLIIGWRQIQFDMHCESAKTIEVERDGWCHVVDDVASEKR